MSALDSRTGSEYWNVPVGALPWKIFPLPDGFVLDTETAIECYELATGTRLWQKPSRDRAALLDAENVGMTAADAIACLRTENGDEVWRARIPEGARLVRHFVLGAWLVVGSSVSMRSMWTECLDAASGKSLWSTAEGAPVAAVLTPDRRQLLLALGTRRRASKIVALRTGTWSQAWSRPLARQGVELVCDGQMAYAGSYDPISTEVGLECLDVADGSTIWTADVRGIVVDHSKYSQVIRLLRRDSWIAVVGCAGAGDYVETFDAETGSAIARWKSAAGLEAESRVVRFGRATPRPGRP